MGYKSDCQFQFYYTGGSVIKQIRSLCLPLANWMRIPASLENHTLVAGSLLRQGSAMLELIDVDVSRIGALGPIVESVWVPQSKERGNQVIGWFGACYQEDGSA